jgi:hypothetical protein
MGPGVNAFCPASRRAIPAACRVGWLLVTLVLIVVPMLDLASGERLHDATRCPVHANPGLSAAPDVPSVALATPLPQLFDPSARVPLLASSIFIPPRA